MKLKKLLIAFLLCFLVLIDVYICAINAIPKKVLLFKGEKINIKTIWGISLEENNLNYKTILTSSETANKQENGTTKYKVKLFGTFNLKDIDVSVIERTKVIPIGQIAGIKMHTSGVLVVGMSEIKGEDNLKYKPYENSGIQEGDIILQVDNRNVKDTKR